MTTDSGAGSGGTRQEEDGLQKGEVSSHETHVSVSGDKLAVRVACDLTRQDFAKVAEEISRQLRELGVQDPKSSPDIEAWLRKQAKVAPIVDAVLAEGTPPTSAQDGRIEWAENFFDTGFLVSEETGQADYRQRKGRRTVSKGERLARLVSPVPGTAGVDVFGAPIAVQKPGKFRVHLGPNVTLDESDQSYYAAEDGRITWAAATLSVLDLYTIKGDIDLKTGDIVHKGSVVVDGDILDGASVEVTGDLEVGGLVEPSTLHVQGNLMIRGGLCGDEVHRTHCDGAVHAKFLLDSIVDAGDAVVVNSEIVHSIVRTRGAVEIGGGRIVGGEITALGGIEADVLGSDASTPTLLIAGSDYLLEGTIAEKEKERDGLVERKKQIDLSVEPLLARMSSLPAEKRGMVRKLRDASTQLGEAIDELQQEINRLMGESREKAVYSIQVRTKLYSETTVMMRREKRTFKQDVDGPLRIEYSKGEIKIFRRS